MIYGLLIVLITCFQPKGVIGIAGRIAEKFGRKPTGGEGGLETVS